MPDLIRVNELQVMAHIGVPDEERRVPQRLLISMELSLDSFAHAVKTDNVGWTVHYGDVVERVKQVVAKRDRKLLETLAEDIAFEVLKGFQIRKITLEIQKFILPDAQSVSVKIERMQTGINFGTVA
jgi:dihydroneopterin aldolase